VNNTQVFVVPVNGELGLAAKRKAH